MKRLVICTLSALALANLSTPAFANKIAVEKQFSAIAKAYFVKAPRLVDYHTTFSGLRVRQAVYYFDLEIPDDAVGSLQQVAIAQRQGSEEIEFRLDQTRAFQGHHRRKQEPITLANVTQDDSTNTINVSFATPIQPGSKITIGLKPKRNPDFEGFYLFGVTAFPAGEKPTGLYLGAARFYFGIRKSH